LILAETKWEAAGDTIAGESATTILIECNPISQNK
jgi:hypothetical protein